MALEHARGDLVDLRAVGHVADLPLAVDLARYLLEQVHTARQKHAMPAAVRELPCDRLADPGRSPGDDSDALPGHGARA